MNNDNIEAYSDFTKELNISTDGKVSVSRRGLARLCGVDEKAIRYLLQETLGAEETGRKISESFAGHKFEGAEEIPDLLAAEIVFHYALLGRELAIKSFKAFTAIGFRTWGQKLLGWEALQTSSIDPQLKRLELALALADRHGVEYATLVLQDPQLKPPLESLPAAKGKPKKPRKVRLLDRSGQIAYHISQSYKNNPDLCPIDLRSCSRSVELELNGTSKFKAINE